VKIGSGAVKSKTASRCFHLASTRSINPAFMKWSKLMNDPYQERHLAFVDKVEKQYTHFRLDDTLKGMFT
jgi:hypothetical protein